MGLGAKKLSGGKVSATAAPRGVLAKAVLAKTQAKTAVKAAATVSKAAAAKNDAAKHGTKAVPANPPLLKAALKPTKPELNMTAKSTMAKPAGAQKIAPGARAALVNKPLAASLPKQAAVAPAKPPQPVDPKFEPFRVLLEAKRAELAGSLGDVVRAAEAQGGRVAEEDQAAQSHEEFISSKRNRMEFRMLRLVQAALGRIANGEYGICHACEEEISEKRLKAIPWAEFCVRCQDEHASNYDDVDTEAATPAGATAVIQAWNW